MRRISSTVPAALLLVGLTWACSEPTSPGAPGDPGPSIDALPRALTSAEASLIARSNDFGIDLMREVLRRDDRINVVLSPLSASMALGMTLNGAAGSTLDGMRAALRMGELSRDEINASYRDLIDLLRALDPAVELSIANATWANEEYTFHQAFFDLVQEYFDAEAESRDFTDPATLVEINDWVERKTNGYIERILDEGELDPALALLLLNAVTFDGTWSTRFDPDLTAPRAFTRADASIVTVDMMNATNIELPFGGTDGLVAAELPYGGGAFTMVVAVPWGERSAREILAEMEAGDWAALIESLTPRKLDALSLPRFEVAYDAVLNEPLAELGMDVAFTRQADFSDLSPTPLCIDFVRQKTFIEVDEAGTRAAAVTGVGIGPTSFTGLVADRPFFFALRERLTGTILFVGLIGDPTVAESEPAEFPAPCRER